MKGLVQAVQRIEAGTRRTVTGGCAAIDALKAGLTPALLQRVQEEIHDGLLQIEERLERLRRRRRGPEIGSRRQDRIRERVARKPELRRLWGEHNRLLGVRELALSHRRAALRQLGDACAWLVLGLEPRLIRALFVEGRRQHLPRDDLGRSPIHVMRAIHEMADFLVVANDLTRCLGVGDITVVRAGQPGTLPVTHELKAQLVNDGREVEIDFHSVKSNHPLHARLFEDLSSKLELQERTDPVLDAADRRQVDEMDERMRIVLQMHSRGERAMAPNPGHWRSMRTVLERAITFGASFDVPEPGVALMALRLDVGTDPRPGFLRLIDRVEEVTGLPQRGLGGATVNDLQDRDEFSPYVPPIALWPLPVYQRAALLSRDLFMGITLTPDTWETAMREAGVTWREEQKHWIVEAGDERGILDPIEVGKRTLGAAFGTESPRAAAQAIRNALLYTGR